MNTRRAKGTRGFTMVEMVVAVGLFLTLMLIIVGSFLSITDAARKARSTRIALDNISAAVDYMAREIRLGSYFHCETDTVLGPGYPGADPNLQTRDCPYGADGSSPGMLLAFEKFGGKMAAPSPTPWDDQLIFRVLNNRLERSINSGVNWEQLTASDIDITSFRLYVEGTASSADQPRITLVLRGRAGGNKIKTQVNFSLQTTLSARTPNISPP